MDKNKYKLLSESKEHYEVEHEDGSRFKVAKAPLSKAVHENIKKFFGGGVVEGFADGGEVEAPEEGEASEEPMQVVDATAEQGEPVAAPAGQAPAQSSRIMEASLPEYEQAFEEQKAAASQAAQAGIQQAQEVAPELEKTAIGLDQLRLADQKNQAARQADSEEFKNSLRNATINPNRLYENMSVPQKILTGIGLVLGGLGGAASGGRNLVADMLNQQVQQDVEAQKADIGNKQSLYKLNLEQTGDERQATALTQRQLLDHVQVEAEKAAARAADPLARSRALGLIGQIDQQKAGLDNQLRLYQWQAQLSTQPFKKEALGILSPDQQKRAVILPDGNTAVLATDEKSAADARQAVTSVKPALDTLNQIEQIRSAVIPLGEKAEQVRSLIPTALLQLKQAQKLGRLSPEAMKLLQQQFSNPADLIDAVRGPAKTRQLRQSLMSQLYTQLQSASPAFQNPNAVPGAVPKYGR